jgi:CRP-like cAMP-binding protein
LEGVGSLSARQRLEQLLRWLIREMGLFKAGEKIRLRLPLKQWEIANYIAVTPEYVSKLMKQMEKEGVIRKEKGWVVVYDPQKLFSADDD